MIRSKSPWLILLLGGLALVGCGPSVDSGPSDAVQEFYKHLNDADYDGALGLYSAETREVLADPESGFEDWARTETRSGTVDKVKVLDQQETGEAAATVEFEVFYNDGTKAARTVTLSQEDGAWKLGFIG